VKGRSNIREGWKSALIINDVHGADTTIHAGKSGVFTLALPGDTLKEAGNEIEVVLYQTFDPAPIARLEIPFSALN